MTFQDPMQNRDTAVASGASGLFARKGEAAPLGGRPAPRRTITLRTPSSERPARLTGELLASKRAALPQPANTFAPGQIDTTNDTTPHGAPAPVEPVPVMIVPGIEPVTGPVMGPMAGAAAVMPLREDAKPVSVRREHTVIRGPVRPTLAELTNRPERKRAAVKRTTLRLDDTLRTRLAGFAASETLSVQSLLTRALECFLPTISIQGSGLTGASEPRDASAAASGGRRSVRFDPHLYWRLKTAAAKRKRSMQSIMTGALMAYLDELEATGPVENGAEIASAGVGSIAGPAPGVTFVDRRPVRFLGAQHAA